MQAYACAENVDPEADTHATNEALARALEQQCRKIGLEPVLLMAHA